MIVSPRILFALALLPAGALAACADGGGSESERSESEADAAWTDPDDGGFSPAGDDAGKPGADAAPNAVDTGTATKADSSGPSSDTATPMDASAAADTRMPGDTATPTDTKPVEPPATAAKKVIAYFAAWAVYGRNFHVTDVDATLLTHLNYAFLNVTNGECMLGDAYADIDKFYPGDSWDAGSLRGSFHQLQLLKQKHPHLKTLLSIGGWTWSAGFSDASSTAAGREKLAKSCTAIATKYGFDGLDIDWEYPGGGGLAAGKPEDVGNFTLLLAAFRKELGTGKLLTIATGAGPAMIKNYELAKIHPYLDSINVMTYDFHGSWEKTTGHNAPMYRGAADPAPVGWSTDEAVSAYLAGGVPASKIIVGAAFYGRGWSGVATSANGLFQSATGPSPGTYEQGIVDYHDIVANYLPTFTRSWDDAAKVPWLFSASRQIMISYDDAQSHGVRTKYVKDKNLGGVMIWELSGDTKEHTLGKAVWNGVQ